MRFDAREVKNYAEPMTADTLVVSVTYFIVQFIDDKLLIPVLEPIIFIGRDLMPEDKGTLYFQDAESHRDGIRFESDWPPSAVFYAHGEHEINHIFEYERALDCLLGCSIRRSKRP